jgi:hypothetical protein
LLLSDEILRFISQPIGSVWALELLLLIRHDTSRAWTVELLSRELRSSAGIVADVLARFRNEGLVASGPDGDYWYRPTSGRIEAIVEQLAETYAKYPVAVTEAIYASPDHKIRLFADAFRLKRE